MSLKASFLKSRKLGFAACKHTGEEWLASTKVQALDKGLGVAAFSHSVGAAIGPTELAFVVFPVAPPRTLKGYQ